jgi:hypothetical protein
VQTGEPSRDRLMHGYPGLRPTSLVMAPGSKSEVLQQAQYPGPIARLSRTPRNRGFGHRIEDRSRRSAGGSHVTPPTGVGVLGEPSAEGLRPLAAKNERCDHEYSPLPRPISPKWPSVSDPTIVSGRPYGRRMPKSVEQLIALLRVAELGLQHRPPAHLAPHVLA